MAESREDFTRKYDSKLQALQEKLERERINGSGSVQELREMESKVSTLTSRNLELESSNAALTKRMDDLVREMEAAAREHRSDIARKVGILTRSWLNKN